MKLYYHPVSTSSRPVLLLAADNNIALDYEVVDLFTGVHMQSAFTGINASQQVPALDDEGFILTESSAILKYLAEKVGSPAYPKDLRQRARVNEAMDWFNTGMYRDIGYSLVYPQCLPAYKREDPAVEKATLAWGRERARRWLGILDQDIIGSRTFVSGNDISVADYLGIGILSLGEVVHLDYSEWKNVSRWIATMKARPSWQKVNEGFYAYFVGPYKDATFEGL